ncbi:hypothetical protein A6U87_13125 [Rhizobium sp. AC44/96]|uniref:BA14K family protein n=1 Tax=unclassified Rhizobium TaxID=2613769 RepID=UPI00080FDD30|nr:MULTISPECIES: BA14K family protein [unclassified Rhizobium]MDM9621755.1 BA14K family protein [Rhizobium sp. S96]OCJ04969.1 hypothetical protein A6U87_13125 [Rhizobium sp. AC44/96]
MNSIAKTLFLTATAAAITFSSIATASADDWHHRHYNHGNDALVGGAVGLATGLIVGSAIAAPRYDEPRYIDPPYAYDDAPVYAAPPPRYYRPVPVRAELEPWTPQWERYCSYRYRSFDPRSGTFIGNDGMSHFCVAS